MKNFLYFIALWVGLLGTNLQAQRLQFIHNSPDPSLSQVDVWVLGQASPLLDDFSFRHATGFLDVSRYLRNGLVTIQVKIAGSSESTQALITKTIALGSGEHQYAVLNGVGDPAKFSNPFYNNIRLQLQTASAQLSVPADEFHFRVFHGISDLPALDVYDETTQETWATGMPYGQASPYIHASAGPHRMKTLISANQSLLALSSVDFSMMGGKSGILVGSGVAFPNTSSNPAASVAQLMVLPDGTVHPLALSASYLQVINNVSDPLGHRMDIGIRNLEVGNENIYRDVEYLSAINLSLASGSRWQVIFYDKLGNPRKISQPMIFEPETNYQMIANGVLNLSLFDLTYNDEDILINIVKAPAASASIPSDQAEVSFMHGMPDAPNVSITVRETQASIARNLPYNHTSALSWHQAEKFVIDASPYTYSQVVASYTLDLRAQGGKNLFIFSSGFMNPSNNQNGPAFGVYYIMPGMAKAVPLRHPSIYTCSTPENLRIAEQTPNSVKVAWQSVSGAEQYRVTYILQDDPQAQEIIAFTSDPHFTITTPKPNKSYKVQVSSFCSYNNTSEPSVWFDASTQWVDCTIQATLYPTIASCPTCADGSIVITPHVGNGMFTYSLDGTNFQENNSFHALTPGDYYVHLKDAVGCEAVRYAMIDYGLCSAPSHLQTTRIANTRASLMWNLVDGANGYLVEITNLGNFSSYSRFRTATYIDLISLTPGTWYKVTVAAECGGHRTAALETTFMTLVGREAGEGFAALNAISIAPNPAKDNLLVVPSAELSNGTLSIFSVTGAKVLEMNSVSCGTEGLQVNIADLPAGMYSVKLQAQGQILQQKFLKQ